MAYSAIDIAKYVVSYCTIQKKPISNLKLQKMLYYLWVDYHKATGKKLFDDDICAWQLGPVVPNVYYEFCAYAGRPITSTSDLSLIDIGQSDIEVINRTIEKYLSIPASNLVNRTHEKGKPWDVIYKDGAGIRDVIPSSLIEMLECGN